MIVVRVELWSAVTKKKTTLAVATICNTKVSQGGKRGDYVVNVAHKRSIDKSNTHNVTAAVQASVNNPLRSGKVEDYPRLAYSVWRLVTRALKSAFPEER